MPSSTIPINECPHGKINVQDNFGFVGGREPFAELLVGASEVKKSVVSISTVVAEKMTVFNEAVQIFAALQHRTFEKTCETFTVDTNVALSKEPKTYKDMLKECNKDVGYIIWVKGDPVVSFPIVK